MSVDNVVQLHPDDSVDDALVRLARQHSERTLKWITAIGVDAEGLPVSIEGGDIDLARAVGLLQVLGTALTVQAISGDD